MSEKNIKKTNQIENLDVKTVLHELKGTTDKLVDSVNHLAESSYENHLAIDRIETNQETLSANQSMLVSNMIHIKATVENLSSGLNKVKTSIDDMALMVNRGFKEVRKDLLDVKDELNQKIDYIALNYMPREKV